MPSQKPNHAELSCAKLLPCVPQRGEWWCIPGSIENMLRCIGYEELTQEKLIVEYIRSFPQPILLQNGADIRALNPSIILALYQQGPLPNANFNTFQKVATRMLQGSLNGWRFHWISGISDPKSYISHMKQSIASDWPTLISVHTGSAWHIILMIAYDGDMIKAYDPGANQIISKSVSAFQFSNDILILRQDSTKEG